MWYLINISVIETFDKHVAWKERADNEPLITVPKLVSF
jgi:hypothetical protein